MSDDFEIGGKKLKKWDGFFSPFLAFLNWSTQTNNLDDVTNKNCIHPLFVMYVIS